MSRSVQLWQYQAKAEGFEPIIPPFDWFVPPADVVRPKKKLVEEQAVLGADPIVPSFDWWEPPADVMRPPHQVRPGFYASPEVEELPILWASETTVVLGSRGTLQYQGTASGEPPTIPAFDWFHQQADVVRSPHQTRPGLHAESLEPIVVAAVPDFGWFVPPADVTRPRPRLIPEAFSHAPIPLPGLATTGVQTTTTVVFPGRTLLYQARAEPILVEVPVPEFDWFQQQPDVVRLPKQLIPEQSVLGPVPIIPAFDWFHQQADVIRPQHQTDEGGAVLGEPPIIPDFDWFVVEPEPVRPSIQLVPEQYVLGEPPTIPTFDWFIAPPDVIRSPEKLVPEQFVLGTPPTIPEFDWFQQESDVVRSKHQVRSGLSALVEFSVPVVIDIDWLSQEPDIIRPLHQVREGGMVLGEPPIIPDFDWFHQQVDVVRPEHQVRPGLWVLGEPTTIPAFDWFVSPPDVIRPKHQVRLGWFASGREEEIIEVDLDWYVEHPDPVLPLHQVRSGLSVLGEPPTILVFDWFQQQFNPLLRPIRPEGLFVRPEVIEVPVPEFDWFITPADVVHAPTRPEGMFVLGAVPIIPAFDWFQQESDVIRPLHQVGPGLFVFLLDIVPPVVPDFGWFIQQADVVRRPLRPLGLHARPLLLIVAPPEELVFAIRICLNLSQLEIMKLLPDPSGFVSIGITLPDPSGYESDEDTTGSLWALADDDDLPSPSGFVER